MIRRTALPLAAAALLAGCNAPNLEPTEGGYAPDTVPATDTGATAPHDSAAEATAIETSPGAADATAGEPAAPDTAAH